MSRKSKKEEEEKAKKEEEGKKEQRRGKKRRRKKKRTVQGVRYNGREHYMHCMTKSMWTPDHDTYVSLLDISFQISILLSFSLLSLF